MRELWERPQEVTDRVSSVIRRRRDREFADALVEAVQIEGSLNDNALVMAADATWEPPSFAKPENARKIMLAKAKRKLKRPDIRARIREVFELADFNVVDAVQMHIAHIRGNAPAGANYQALKDYEAMVFEQAPKTMNINQRNLHMNVPLSREGAPAIAPRILGSAKVEE